MQERKLLPGDWVTKLKAAQIKSEELRTNYPVKHQEAAVVSVHKDCVANKGTNTEDFIYKDTKEVFVRLTEGTEEGR
jgi:hypothetical protein